MSNRKGLEARLLGGTQSKWSTLERCDEGERRRHRETAFFDSISLRVTCLKDLEAVTIALLAYDPDHV